MEETYLKCISLCSYDEINSAASYNDVNRKIIKIISKLEDYELNDLRIYIYKKKVEYENSKETSFSSHLPYILLIPGTFASYLGSVVSQLHGEIWGFAVIIGYMVSCGIVILTSNNKLMKKHTNRIRSHLLLEKMIDDEIIKRKNIKMSSIPFLKKYF